MHPQYTIPQASGIYRITCTVTKRFYIGSTANLYSRWKEHRNQLARKSHHSITLQRAWDKYGEQAFIFEVIELVLVPFLLEREQYWLDKLNPFGRRGYNHAHTAGSRLGVNVSLMTREKLRLAQSGKTHSEETRRKIAEARTGKTYDAETRERIRLVTLGHPVSAETREKLRDANLGKTHRPESIEKVRKALIGRPVSAETRAKIGTANAAHKKARSSD